MRKMTHFISLLFTHGNIGQSSQPLHMQQNVLNKSSLHTGLSVVFSLMLVLFCSALSIYPNDTIPARMSTNAQKAEITDWDNEYLIGPGMEHSGLAEALAALPENAGNVHFRLSADLSETDDLFLPTDKGISHLKIDCDDPNQPVFIDLSEHDLFANGIPLTIERGVSFTNGRIFGGAKVPQDASAPLHLKSTNLTINGGAKYVFGGGLSDVPGQSLSIETASVTIDGTIEVSAYGGSYAANGGLSEITQSASVQLKAEGLVKGSLFGGSRAVGENSQTTDVQTSAVIEGTVEHTAIGGSAARDGGNARITQSASFHLKAEGLAKDCIYGGSYATGTNSVSSNVQTSTVIEGTVEITAYGGSLSGEGGHTEITESASIQLKADGLVKGSIFGGSVASGTDSQTTDVQTSVVIEGTVEGLAYGGSYAANGGHTEITESASVQLKTDALVKESILGGSRASGENSQATDVQTSAVIEGTVEDWAYGGSIAVDGGHSEITDSASLELKVGGLVKNDIYGGSHATGENSQTSDVQTSAIIEGTVEGWAYGGSIAQAGGHTQITDSASVQLKANGLVTGSILGGSRAFGTDSQTTDVQTGAVIEGTVEGWVYGGSSASNGGHTQITDSASVQLKAGGLVKNDIYGGSWASDENSQATDVQTSVVVEGTVEGWAFGGSIAQAGGHTQITDSASVQLKANGLVTGSILGGSRASGENSQATDVQTGAVIEGTVEGLAYGGSYASNGGLSEITQSASIQLKADGLVKINVYGGSRASGENSQTFDVQTSAVIEGTVEGWVHGGSEAGDGGHSSIIDTASLQLNPSGLVKNNVFGGSFASGASLSRRFLQVF